MVSKVHGIFRSGLVASLFLVGCGDDPERIGIAEQASHSWSNYHWARTSNPFGLKLGDNVNSTWDAYLTTTSSDWSTSSVLDTTIVAGGTSTRRCQPTAGRVEVCNGTYGHNGWLGVAQVWISAGSHIVQGTVKLNDSYFNMPAYNTTAWRNLVMCQEVGHTLGLDHQDEVFDNPNLGTCMDYTSDPSTNQHPNAHDYEELQDIYAHLDATTTVGALPSFAENVDFNAPEQWGELREVSPSGHRETHVRTFDDFELVTFVAKAD